MSDKAAKMSRRNVGDDMYCLMDFLHLSGALDLGLLASALTQLVGAEFTSQDDPSVKCMASCWGCHEVIVTHPSGSEKQANQKCKELNESNAGTYITLVMKSASSATDDMIKVQSQMASSVAQTIATIFQVEVLHSKSWNVIQGLGTLLNRRYHSDGSVLDTHNPIVFACGWEKTALATSIDSLRPTYTGPLDFMFIVHPRSYVDKRQPFPLMRGLDEKRTRNLVPPCTILSSIEVPIGDRLLRGELVSIPHSPEEMLDQLPEARDAVVKILDYAAHRKTKMVGLGALIPSITRHGKLLRKVRPDISFTTGHGFTALTIARMVEDIESEVGDQGVVAVIGAAGSTGRAALRCMFKRRPTRRILAIDVSLQLAKIGQIPGWNPEFHRCTAAKHELKQASIVVCVTNATGSILEAEDFGPNTVVLDDAQPENVSESVLTDRPDLRIVKCLARIPHLSCPFDMGLFTSDNRDDEISYTCLAETILLAAENYPESYIVGDPTDHQFEYLESLAEQYRVTPAKFYSFPSIGYIVVHPSSHDFSS